MSEESDSVYYGSGDMVSPVEQVEGGTRDSASSSSASSSSPAAAAAAAGHATYSSAEVEEIRLHYREEALKAVEVARRKALTDARDHFEETIRRLEEERDNLATVLADATASGKLTADNKSNTNSTYCANCDVNSSGAAIKSVMEKVYRSLKQEFGTDPAMTARLKRALRQATESLHVVPPHSAASAASSIEAATPHAPLPPPPPRPREPPRSAAPDPPSDDVSQASVPEPTGEYSSDPTYELHPVIKVEPVLSHFFDSARKIRYRLSAKLSIWTSAPEGSAAAFDVVVERKYSDFVAFEKRARESLVGRRAFIFPSLAPKDPQLRFANESSIRRRVQYLTSWLRLVTMHREIQLLPGVLRDFLCDGLYPTTQLDNALAVAVEVDRRSTPVAHRSALLSQIRNFQNEQSQISEKVFPCLEAASRLVSAFAHYDSASDAMLRGTSSGAAMGTDADEILRSIGTAMFSARSTMLASKDLFMQISDCMRFFADPCIQAATTAFSHASSEGNAGSVPISILQDVAIDWQRLLWLHAYDTNESYKDAVSSMLENLSHSRSMQVRPDGPAASGLTSATGASAHELRAAVRAEMEMMDEKYHDVMKRSHDALLNEDKHDESRSSYPLSSLSGASIAKSLLSFGSLGISFGTNSQEVAGRQQQDTTTTARQSDTFESFEANTMSDVFEEFEERKTEGTAEQECNYSSAAVEEEPYFNSDAKTNKDAPNNSSLPSKAPQQPTRRVVGLRHRVQKPSVTNNATAAATEPIDSPPQEGSKPPSVPKKASHSTNSYSWDSQAPAPVAAPVTNQAPAPQPQPQTPLADGWEEVVLPDSSVYYYHRQTRETSWNRPMFQNSAPANAIPNANASQGSAPAPAPTAASASALKAPKDSAPAKEAVKIYSASEDPEIIVRDALNGWMKIPNTPSLRNICDLLNTVGFIIPTISSSDEFISSFDGKKLNIRTSAPDEVRKYFLKMARFIHPDKLSSALPQVEKAIAEAAFVVLNEAYNRYKFGNGMN